jgi:hypothetical protein
MTWRTWLSIALLAGAAGTLGLVALRTATGADPRGPTAPDVDAAPPPDAAVAAVDAEDPAGLRIEVLGVRRAARDVIEVRLALENRLEVPLVLDGRLAERPGEKGTLSGAYLTNAEATSRYHVLRDTSGAPACSSGLERLEARERREAWARFPSPGARAAPLTLHLPGMAPIPGIPLAGAGEG